MARRRTPQFYYNAHKQTAKQRGIEWQFTFEQWWAIWRDSGKWGERGCKRGQYVMARHGDQGPYAPWNVSIMEAGKNGSDGLKGWPAKKKARVDSLAAGTASAPTTADNPQTPPSSLGCMYGKEAANSSTDIATAARTFPAPVQLYDQPRPVSSSHNNGTSSHKVAGPTNGAISTQRSNKNLDQENEIGLSLINQMGMLVEAMKNFFEKKIHQTKRKEARDHVISR